MAKVLRDKSGRLFVECNHFKGNKAYWDAQLPEKDMPPAMRKDGKRASADEAAKQEQAKAEEAAKREQERNEQAQAPKPATKPAPKTAEQKTSPKPAPKAEQSTTKSE